MTRSPRVAQYILDLSDDELDAIVTVPAGRVELQGVDPVADAKLLGDALRRVFWPDAQARATLRHLVSLAKAHAEFHFDTDEKYIAGLYAKVPWGTVRSPAVCLSGLAGTGKTALLLALARLLAGTGFFNVEGHSDIPLDPVWAMTLAQGDGLNQLLGGHVAPKRPAPPDRTPTPEEEGQSLGWKIPALLKAAERVSWRGATCLAFVDEFQWIAASSTANARATKVLLQLYGIGPLLAYCANFSLVHKLKSRPQENRDRLLSKPILLTPLAAKDPDWTRHLKAIRSVAPDVLTFDPEKDGDNIHLYTCGIKRKVADLIVIGYLLPRRTKSKRTVGLPELLAAYQSADYTMHREDVEVLIRQEVTGKVEREDLWCPFPSIAVAVPDGGTANPIVDGFEQRTEEALVAAAMTPDEAAAHKKLKPDAAPTKRSAKVFNFQRKKPTKEDLLAGAAALDKLD